MKNKLTVKEIRKILFDTDKYAVIGIIEMTNEESRNFLYEFSNQDYLYNVIDNDSHLLIY
jgi:hypothetical protein